ncbi:C-C motif chemokine 8-like [Chanodichthys erythropterus]|uniref:C-C motif chemokine 8-like n=1 Tax=Chanodichthys erythropterus TaxID=933992 RepID=UPI00351EF5E5
MKSHMLGFHAVLLLWLLVSSSMQEEIVKGESCLTTTDTKVPVRNLRSYTRQRKPVFPVNAVRFLTVKGITICSDPSSPWAIKAMKYLDEKKKPQSRTVRRSVTAPPKNTSTINMTRSSAQIETQTIGQK